MRKARQELKQLRFDIQRERATLRALKRHSARMHGKPVRLYGNEVIHSSSTSDAERIEFECGVIPDSPASMKQFLDDHQRLLDEKRARVAQLKHELDSRLPLTPCGMVVAIVKAKRKQARQRKRNR